MTITNSLVLADNAYGTLGSGLLTSDTTLTWTAGHGARFPVVGAGQVLYCCLLNSNNVVEEIKITAHTAGADTATMVRAANGTTAKAWNVGDRVEARVSSEVLKRIQDEALKAITLSTGDGGATYTGGGDVPVIGYVTGLLYPMTSGTSNSTTTPAINLDSNGNVNVVLDGGGALAVGQMPINGLYKYDGTNFILLNPVPGMFASLTVTGTATFSGNVIQGSGSSGQLSLRSDAGGSNGGRIDIGGSGSSNKVDIVIDGGDGLIVSSSGAQAVVGMKPAFESAELSISSGSALYSALHGMSNTPKILSAIYRCKTAELGYSIGDEMQIQITNDGSSLPAIGIFANSTTVGISVTANVAIARKDTQVRSGITVGSWVIVLRCW